MTDLSILDATAQAELVRTGDASAAELVDAAIARIEKLQRRAERGDPSAVRPRPRRGAERRCPTDRSAACRSSSRISTARSPARRTTPATGC